jgi:hypothetical protein
MELPKDCTKWRLLALVALYFSFRCHGVSYGSYNRNLFEAGAMDFEKYIFYVRRQFFTFFI